MARMLGVAIMVVLMAFTIQESVAVKCWNCVSGNNNGCGDPFDEAKVEKGALQNCPANEVCTKNKVKDVISRACGQEELCKKAADNSCVSCNTDGCNGASQYAPIAAFIALPAAVALLMKNLH